ncbi:MAG: enoyl-CoA hydratase/isomerase family protein [Candidatus Helarchaeota archaeon]
MNETVKVDYHGSIATITINRPEKRNAINNDVIEGVIEAAKIVDKSDDVKVVILTGAGEKAFSAGADIEELSNEDGLKRQRKIEVSHIIYGIRKPVIAMVRGYAVGGGCELALACDFRIASENAKFGFPEIKMGWIPGGGGTQLLPKIISQGIAMELLLSGDFIDAEKAKEIGLINKVCPDSKLEEETYKIAKRIGEHSMMVLKFIKDAVRMSSQLDINSGFAYEKKLLALCFNTKEKDEGVRRFLKK